MTDYPEHIYMVGRGMEDEVVCLVSPLDSGRMQKYTRSDLVPQWQPIETAPKDGRSMVVYDDMYDVGTARWNGHRFEYDFDDGGMSYHPCDATHWMPLPSPPKETAK